MLNTVSKYCYKWRYRINNKKSQVVIYSTQINSPDKENWILNKKEIEQVDSYKYFGIKFERKRKWNSYKTKIFKKAKKAAGILKWISRANPFIKTKTLQKIWYGLGRSILEYGAVLFNITDKWKKAEILENKVMRFILKLKGRTNTASMQGELD